MSAVPVYDSLAGLIGVDARQENCWRVSRKDDTHTLTVKITALGAIVPW
jgi:hypothetical protein